jgi:hypothetical protein
MTKRRKSSAVSKPPALRGLMKGVSLGKDEDGYFVHTHRARSKSYPSPEKIPESIVKRIESTG